MTCVNFDIFPSDPRFFTFSQGRLFQNHCAVFTVFWFISNTRQSILPKLVACLSQVFRDIVHFKQFLFARIGDFFSCLSILYTPSPSLSTFFRKFILFGTSFFWSCYHYSLSKPSICWDIFFHIWIFSSIFWKFSGFFEFNTFFLLPSMAPAFTSLWTNRDDSKAKL